MFNSEIRIVYKGDNTPFYLETNKKVDNNKLELFKYDNESNEWIKLEATFNNIVDNIYKTEYIFNDLGIVLLKVTFEDIEIAKLIINIKNNILQELYEYNVGNWQIKDNKMIFYDTKGNVLAEYKLYDKDGNPTEESVYLREKI